MHRAMHRLTGLIAVAPIALFASIVIADDSMGRVTPTDSQLLKQCMERQPRAPSSMAPADPPPAAPPQ